LVSEDTSVDSIETVRGALNTELIQLIVCVYIIIPN